MKLSRKKAIELCIELWTWCARTGKHKSDWPEWEKYSSYNHPKGSITALDCWFCEYSYQRNGNSFGCEYCPIMKKLKMECTDDNCFYSKWEGARTPRTRKKYAKLFLAQIKKCK